MADGGADAPSLPPENGGEFLLSLLHRKPYNQERHDPLTRQQPSTALNYQPLALDPAVAAVGPSVTVFPPSHWPSDRRDLPGTSATPWPHTLPPSNHPASLLGFPQFPLNTVPANQLGGNQRVLGEDGYKLGFSGTANHAIQSLVQQHQQPPPPPPSVEQQKLLFGSFSVDSIQTRNGLHNGGLVYDSNLRSAKDHERHPRNPQSVFPNSNTDSNLSQNRNFDHHERRGGYSGRESWGHSGNNRSFKSTTPPGFSSKQRGWDRDIENNDSNNSRGALQQNVDRVKAGNRNLSNTSVNSTVLDDKLRSLSIQNGGGFKLSQQLGRPGPPAGSNLDSASASEVEVTMLVSQTEAFADSLLHGDEVEDKDVKDDKDDKKKRLNFRDKESRVDERGQWLLSQRKRMDKWHMVCRNDIHGLNAHFLAVYESLIPAQDELPKQKQLLSLLEKLVCKEWPEAKLFLYGSCANSFGFPKSDIDVCLTIEDAGLNKSEMLLKLAGILQSDNLQNVQALTRARVPIVKLMDPVTGISGDICINNVLAVVNTKLLRDYAQIDVRLRQLAFIVKHWAKSRRVNETYRGTLSSYAYVLMCIHFLQQRSPAILPCLQSMEPTYSVTVDNIQCAYFDEVDKLRNFGSRNRETIAQLVWGFFKYWAYGHDYANSVISVRTGSIISKRQKDWTRRVGNDRHLICIEDPFETSHDLGRVVDKFSIRVLREEFERAAEIMQHDQNPCENLFEPYVRGNH